MAEEEVLAEIKIEKAPPGTVPFIPGAGERIVIEFEPEPYVRSEPVPGLESLWPQTPRYDLLPDLVIPGDPWVMDIETTGLKPHESRIICIGLKSLKDRYREPIQMMDMDEEKILVEFRRWMKALNPSQLVGWGLGFDYKFIFRKLATWRIECKELQETKFYDLADVYRRGTEHYTWTMQKMDKLADVSITLLDREKMFQHGETLEAWLAKDYEGILAHNLNDIEIIADLWLLAQHAMGEGELAEELIRTTPGIPTTVEDSRIVKCPVCMSERVIPIDSKPGACPVCGARYPGD